MLEGIFVKIFEWMTVTYPPIGIALMVLGGIFFLCEILIKATDTKKDDAILARYLDGYAGVLFRAIKRMAPAVLSKVFKKKE